jgi:hypothetical protein
MTTLAPGMGAWLASALVVVCAATATAATSRVAQAHPHVVVRSSPDPATFPGLGPGASRDWSIAVRVRPEQRVALQLRVQASGALAHGDDGLHLGIRGCAVAWEHHECSARAWTIATVTRADRLDGRRFAVSSTPLARVWLAVHASIPRHAGPERQSQHAHVRVTVVASAENERRPISPHGLPGTGAPGLAVPLLIGFACIGLGLGIFAAQRRRRPS